jgi:hypothetical protein
MVEKTRLQNFESFRDVQALVTAFEAAEVKPAEFSHLHHLAVAAYYLLNHGPDRALTLMRDGLFGVLRRNNLDAYNETITVFWLKYAEQRLASARSASVGGNPSYLELINSLLAACPAANLIFDYYSKELLSSDTARRQYVEPDRGSIL